MTQERTLGLGTHTQENTKPSAPTTKKRNIKTYDIPLPLKIAAGLSTLFIGGSAVAAVVSGGEIKKDSIEHEISVQRAILDAQLKFPIPSQNTIRIAKNYYANPTPYNPQWMRLSFDITQNNFYNHQEEVRLGATRRKNTDDANIFALGGSIAGLAAGVVLLAGTRIAFTETVNRRKIEEIYEEALPNFFDKPKQIP